MSDIIFHEVILRNFMSYGNVPVRIPLDLPGTTLIQGKNLDNTETGIVANGVGKSVIIHAIVYALYGEPLSNSIKLDELVNDINEKNCGVTVNFSVNGSHYSISRYRKSKEGPNPNYVTLFKDRDTTINLADDPSVGSINTFIESLIGMPKELFIRLVTYDADEESFLTLPAQKQRDILENLFNLTILSEKAEILKKKSADTSKLIDFEQLEIDQQLTNVENYRKRLSVGQKRVDDFELLKKSQIETIQREISKFSSINYDNEMEIFELNKNINDMIGELKNSITDLNIELREKDILTDQLNNDIKNTSTLVRAQNSESIQEVKQRIDSINHDIKTFKQQFDVNVSTRKSLEREVDQLELTNDTIEKTKKMVNEKVVQYLARMSELAKGKCPECGQNIETHDSHSINYNEKVEQSQKELNSLQDQITENLKKIVSISNTLNDTIHETNEDVLFEYVSSKQKEISKLETQLQQLNSDIESKIEIQVKPIKDRIEEIKGEKTILLLTRDKVNLMIEEKQQFIKIGLFSTQVELINSKNSFEALQIKLTNKLDEINPHLDALDDLIKENVCDPEYTVINKLKNQLDHEKFLIKLLTDKKSFLRKALISRRLPYLNERLKYYLKQIGLPHHVEIQSDFTPIIKKRGKIRGFGGLSHGQKARVNFALSFAFRDVLNQMHKRINICILDEVLDKALCGVGTLSAMNMITEKAKNDGLSMFVITHKNELATRFKRHLTVTMKGGFSSVSIEEKSDAA